MTNLPVDFLETTNSFVFGMKSPLLYLPFTQDEGKKIETWPVMNSFCS